MNTKPILAVLASGITGFLLGWVILLGINSFVKGFVSALIISFLVAVGYDIFIYCSMNLYSGVGVVVDVTANSLLGGLMGV